VQAVAVVVAVALDQVLAQTLVALARLLVITAVAVAAEGERVLETTRAMAAMAHKVSLSLLIQQRPLTPIS
jgi:hypothetical protein